MAKLLLRERGNFWLRFIDQWIGIPLIFFLGLFSFRRIKHGKRSRDLSPSRILLIQIAAIGDTILLSAMIREIREKYPRILITVVCSRGNLCAAELLEGIDETKVIDFHLLPQGLEQLRKLPKQDLVLDFGPWSRFTACLSYLIPSDFKIGFERQGQHRHYIFDQAVLHQDCVHEIDNYRALLKEAGIKPIGYRPALILDSCFKAPGSSSLVVLHPFPGGSGKALKEWPEQNWVEIGCFLNERGFIVVISGGPEDAMRAEKLAREICDRGGKATALAGKLSLRSSCDVLYQAALLISVNTGIMHLGAALGIRVIALNGPTSVIRWGALGDMVINLVSPMECAPCISLGFEYKCTDGGCMSAISVTKVKHAVGEITECPSSV